MNRNRVGSLANSFMTDNSELIDERLIQHQQSGRMSDKINQNNSDVLEQ